MMEKARVKAPVKASVKPPEKTVVKATKQMKISLLVFMVLFLATACGPSVDEVPDVTTYTSWNQVVEDGSGKQVTILMWGGNDSINQYMDTYVSHNLLETYGVKLNRIPMNAPDYLAKLINEKKSNVATGTADLLWINAENFRRAKEGGLIDGPFTDLLPNLGDYYDGDSSDLSFDSGIPIEGYEGIWGKAQLVLSYDEAVVPNPPRTFKELALWMEKNPGKFTYPRVPDDFVGTAFVRSAFYEVTGESDLFLNALTKQEFETLGGPVMEYFKRIKPYLWRQGEAYPATQAKLDELFTNGEVYMTMGFEVGKTAGQIAKGVYPHTVKSYVFDTGTIGNSHYLAIPYNAPEKAAALLVMDFLQSPQAQLEKMKPEVWGDMPAFDVTKLSEEHRLLLDSLDGQAGSISLKDLNEKRLPEMEAKYIEWMKELWVNEVGN